MENFIVAIIKDEKGIKDFYQFDNEEQKQKKFGEMLKCYNQIKALFGDKTDQVLDYINKHKYSLDKGELGA